MLVPLLELEMMGSVYSCLNLNPEPSSKDSNVKNSTEHMELRKTWCMFVQLLTDVTSKVYKDETYIYIYIYISFLH